LIASSIRNTLPTSKTSAPIYAVTPPPIRTSPGNVRAGICSGRRVKKELST
jgi:hypothetical protein